VIIMANTSPQAIAEPFPTPDPGASGRLPSERWVRAFNAQATQATYRAAVKFARFRARLIEMAGKKADRAYVQELVHDAFGDTWAGDPPWNPESCSLLDHVRGLIRHRSWKDAQWLRRHPHVPLSECDERAAIRAKSSHGIDALPQSSPIMLAEMTAEVVGLLRRLARGDDEVTRILDAWQDGHVDRVDVMVATGLSPSAYKATRARVAYLVQNLPQSVRDRAIDILRSDK
jgi:hypothetical protein